MQTQFQITFWPKPKKVIFKSQNPKRSKVYCDKFTPLKIRKEVGIDCLAIFLYLKETHCIHNVDFSAWVGLSLEIELEFRDKKKVYFRSLSSKGRTANKNPVSVSCCSRSALTDRTRKPVALDRTNVRFVEGYSLRVETPGVRSFFCCTLNKCFF